jgi:outer membrane protein assembly factor BamB
MVRKLLIPFFLIGVICLSLSCSEKKDHSQKTVSDSTHSAIHAKSNDNKQNAITRSSVSVTCAEIISNDGFSSQGILLKNGDVLLFSDSGWVFLLNTVTGDVIYAEKTDIAMGGVPVVFANQLVIGDSDGLFSSLDLSGILQRSQKNNDKEREKHPKHPIKKSANLKTISRDWSFKTDGKIVGGCAIVMKKNGIDDAAIVFGSYDTNIYCVKASNGKLKWKIKTGNFINGSPILVNNEICIGGCDGKLRFINPKTGTVVASINMGSYIPSSPTALGTKCLVALYTGEIVCVNTTSHNVEWRWKNEEKGKRLNFTTSPLIYGDCVLAVSTRGECVALSLKTGKLIWNTKIPCDVEAAAVVSQNTQCLFLVDGDGTARVIDIKKGGETASFATGEPISTPPMPVGDGKFLLASENGIVIMLRINRPQGRKLRVSHLWSLRPHSAWLKNHPRNSLKP